MSTTIRRMSPARISFVAGAVMALFIALVVYSMGVTGAERRQAGAQDHPSIADSDFIPAAIKEGEPCPEAVPSSTTELTAIAGLDVWLPDAKSLPPLTGAWMCTGTPTFDYEGISFAYEPGWKLEDPEGRWKAMAEQWGRGEVGTVLGRPAFVLPASEIDPRGEVLVVVDDTLVRVLGDGKTSIESLIASVESLQLPAELTLR